MRRNVLTSTGLQIFRRLIPLLLVAMSLTAAEVPIAPVVEGAAVLSQFAESGASDGSDYLFVWIDGQTGGYERRATRVTREGEVLDRDGIRLPGVYSRNGVVWTGESYMLIWDEGHPYDIRMMRIGRDGKIVGGPRTVKQRAVSMSVVSNGTHVVIGYHTHESPSDAIEKRALFLDADGEPVADILLDRSSDRGTVNVAWNGKHFAAVWVDDPEAETPQYALKGLRFDVTGTLDAAPRRLFEDSSPTFVATPALASDGDGFLTVSRIDGNRQVARRLSADLTSAGAPELLPALNYELLPQLNLSSPIFWNGTNYLIVGHDGQAISAVRLDRDGRTAGVEVIENATGQGTLANPVAATNGRDLLVGWTGRFSADPHIGSDVFGTIVSASTLDPRRRTLLSISPQHQRRPLIASGGTNLLAVWQQGVALYARRLALNGLPLDAVPIRLAERATPTAVVFNGTDYIVVWPRTTGYEVTGLVTARVPREGPLRVDGGTTLAGARPLSAASDGTTTLLAWQAGYEPELHVGRLAADGSIAASVAFTPTWEESWYGRVAITPGAKDFLIVWEELSIHMYASPPIESSSLRGARISPDLVPLDPAGIDIAVNDRDERFPAVAWNGRNWLMIFQTLIPPTSLPYEYRLEIRGRHISPEGLAEGPVDGVFITSHGSFPSLAWDGGRYFLTWHTDSVNTSMAGSFTLLGEPVTHERTIQHLFDWNPIPLVAIRPGVVGATYARPTVEPPYEVTRPFVNFMSVKPRRRSVR